MTTRFGLKEDLIQLYEKCPVGRLFLCFSFLGSRSADSNRWLPRALPIASEPLCLHSVADAVKPWPGHVAGDSCPH